jgi:hypothetical protein
MASNSEPYFRATFSFQNWFRVGMETGKSLILSFYV